MHIEKKNNDSEWRSKASWTAITALVAIIISILTLYQQIAQSRVAMWRSLSDEYNYSLREDRAKCAEDYLNNGDMLGEACEPVLGFFESLGYLVKHSRIDVELAQNSFSDFLSAYFNATKKYIGDEQSDDPMNYENLVYLHKLWGDARWAKSMQGLNVFFQSELHSVEHPNTKVKTRH